MRGSSGQKDQQRALLLNIYNTYDVYSKYPNDTIGCMCYSSNRFNVYHKMKTWHCKFDVTHGTVGPTWAATRFSKGTAERNIEASKRYRQ